MVDRDGEEVKPAGEMSTSAKAAMGVMIAIFKCCLMLGLRLRDGRYCAGFPQRWADQATRYRQTALLLGATVQRSRRRGVERYLRQKVSPTLPLLCLIASIISIQPDDPSQPPANPSSPCGHPPPNTCPQPLRPTGRLHPHPDRRLPAQPRMLRRTARARAQRNPSRS